MKKQYLQNERGNLFCNAHIKRCGECYTLVSYTTPVCMVWWDAKSKCWKFERIAYSDSINSFYESRTTMRHINCFRRDFNMEILSLDKWRKM